MQIAGYIVCLVIFYLIGAGTTFAHFYIRGFHWGGRFVSWVIVFAQVFQCALLGMGVTLLVISQHPSSTTTVDKAMKLTFSYNLIYYASMWSVKIYLMLMAMFLTHKTPVYKLTVATMIFIIATAIAAFTVSFFSCWPFSRNFTSGSLPSCHRNVFWVYYSMNIASFIALYIIPFFILKTVKSRIHQVHLGIMCMVFLMLIVFATLRVILIMDRSIIHASSNGVSARVTVISNLECTLGMVAMTMISLSKPWASWVDDRSAFVAGMSTVRPPRSDGMDFLTKSGEVGSVSEGKTKRTRNLVRA